jgi:hypothetical protein
VSQKFSSHLLSFVLSESECKLFCNNDIYSSIDIFDKPAATELFQGRKYVKYFIVILLLLLIEIY